MSRNHAEMALVAILTTLILWGLGRCIVAVSRWSDDTLRRLGR